MRQSLILLQFNECLCFGGFFCGKAELCAENALREGSAGYIFPQHDVNKVLCQVFITAAVGARGLHRDVIHPIGHVVDVGDAFGVEIKFAKTPCTPFFRILSFSQSKSKLFTLFVYPSFSFSVSCKNFCLESFILIS